MGKALGIAGLVASLMAVACSGVAQYLDRWAEIGGLTPGRHGVWRVTLDAGGDSDWLDYLTTDTEKRNAQIVRYALLGGGVFLLGSIAMICAFLGGPGHRVLAIVASVLSCVAVGAHTAAVALFHVKFEPEGDDDYSYAFWLAIAAAGLSLVSGVLKIAAAATADPTPNKVDNFEQSKKRGQQGKTNVYNARSKRQVGQQNSYDRQTGQQNRYGKQAPQQKNYGKQGAQQNGYGKQQANRSIGGSQTNRSYGGQQTNRSIGGQQTNRSIGGQQSNRSYGGSQRGQQTQSGSWY